MNEILAVFRVIAPELIWVQDDQVKAMIALYEGFVSKKTFGTKYNLAVASLFGNDTGVYPKTIILGVCVISTAWEISRMQF